MNVVLTMSFSVCVRALLLGHFVVFSVNVIDAYAFNENSSRPQIVSRAIAGDENQRPSLDDYMNQRRALINEEFQTSFESDVTLTENEQRANEVIMRAKNKELIGGLANPAGFNPSRHIFEVLQNVTDSDLFKILHKMPKGAILHSHDAGMCSADYLVTLTYWPNLWQCTANGVIAQLFFSRVRPPPNHESTDTCTWTLVSEERQRVGAAKYDEYVRKLFTLFDKDVHPKIQYRDINDVWQAMMGIFARITPMLCFAPVWKSYYKQALKEAYADNVQYLEFRSTLPPVRPHSYHLNISLNDQFNHFRFMIWMAVNIPKKKLWKYNQQLLRNSKMKILVSLDRKSFTLREKMYQTKRFSNILRSFRNCMHVFQTFLPVSI